MITQENTSALPLLHSMHPEILAAQEAFNAPYSLAKEKDDRPLSSGRIDPALRDGIERLNAVLEKAFEALLLDIKSLPTGHSSTIQGAQALRSIHRPRNEHSLWFNCEKPEYTAVLLLAASKDGNLSHLTDPFAGDAGLGLMAQMGAEKLASERPRKVVTEDFLLWRLEKSLRAGDVVDIGSLSLRKAQRGDVWIDSENRAFKALEDGLFVQDKGKATAWIHAGPFYNLDLVVQPQLASLSEDQINHAYECMLHTAAKRMMKKVHTDPVHGFAYTKSIRPA